MNIENLNPENQNNQTQTGATQPLNTAPPNPPVLDQTAQTMPTTPTVPTPPQVPPIENINMTPPPETINLNPEGVASAPAPTPPEPLMGATLTSNTPLTNQNLNNQMTYTSGQNNINSLDNSQMSFQTPITSVPETPNSLPPEPTSKKGKKGRKSLLIIIIFILIMAIGFGVYYFLNMGKTTAPAINITPIFQNLELGDSIPTEPAKFVTVTGLDINTCTVNSSEINNKKIGNYNYSVTCAGRTVTGTVTVKDTKGPVVKLKTLRVTPNTTVTLNDFVVSCTDPSLSNGCNDIKIKEDIDLNEIIKTPGTYNFTLLVSDDYASTSPSEEETHITEAKATLIVDENAPSLTITCSLKNNNIKTTYEYGLTAERSISLIEKTTTEEYEDEQTYTEAKEKLPNTSDATTDDEEQTITTTEEYTMDKLMTELKLENAFTGYEDIFSYHENAGYTCSLS